MKSSNDKSAIPVIWIFGIAFLFLATFVISVSAFCQNRYPGLIRYYLTGGGGTPEYDRLTTPLEPGVVQDVCSKFNISNQLICQEGQTVYADQLNRVVVKIMAAEKHLTYGSVEKRLGKYKYQCSDTFTQRDGTEYFDCTYDFRGDHVYWITIGYLQNGTVIQMNYYQYDPFP